MPAAGKADVTFDKANTLITAGDATHTSIRLQDLYDAIREYEDNLINMDIDKIVDGDGKQGIGGGDTRPITVTILAPWTVRAFPGAGPATRLFTFDGGTILSGDERDDVADPARPFTPAAFVQYDRAKAQEGALLNFVELLDIWNRLYGGSLHTDPTTGKERIEDAAAALYSEANIWSDDEVTAYDGTKGIAKRGPHVKP